MNRKNILSFIFVFLIICGVCSGKNVYNNENKKKCAERMAASIKVRTTLCYPGINESLFQKLCNSHTECVDHYVYDDTWCGLGFCENKCIGKLKDIICEWRSSDGSLNEPVGYIYNDDEEFNCHVLQYVGSKTLRQCYPKKN